MSGRPMRVAFHTPLKPVDHPVPSGDRQVGRGLVDVFTRLGHAVVALDSDPAGLGCLALPEDLPRRRDGAIARADRLIAAWRGGGRASEEGRDLGSPPDLWLTYHLWYKKPDWIGPRVARALGIPYVVAEASYAPKRAGGPWDIGHRATAEAVRAADLVLTLNPDDAACLAPLLVEPGRNVVLPPFLDIAPFAAAAEDRDRHRALVRTRFGWRDDVPILIVVAMMRAPDKTASYALLGRALARLSDRDWHLLVVGDGAARGEVEAILAPLGQRVAWAGAVAPNVLPALYACADLYVWPAVNEAFGIGLMEAQASGVPVIAGRTRGVPAVVGDGESGLLPALGDVETFAAAVRLVLDDAGLRARLAAGASDRAARLHGLDAATRNIGAALRGMLARRARERAA